MEKLSISTVIVVLAFITSTATSCQDTKKENNKEEVQHSERMNENGAGMEVHSKTVQGNIQSSGKMMVKQEYAMMSSQIIGDYLSLKNALVADDQEAAAKAGEILMIALEDFDKSKFKENQRTAVIDIIEDATEHVEHIAKSDLDHQREHFDILSKDLIDLIAITGTKKTLYQDFCPMYNNNKGAQWLSATKEIKNPYFGSKMMACGTVQKQIN